MTKCSFCNNTELVNDDSFISTCITCGEILLDDDNFNALILKLQQESIHIKQVKSTAGFVEVIVWFPCDNEHVSEHLVLDIRKLKRNEIKKIRQLYT